MTGLSIGTSINGSLGNASLLTVDGGFNMDSGSNNSQISNVGIEHLQRDEPPVQQPDPELQRGRIRRAQHRSAAAQGADRNQGDVLKRP
jgi:hypothetical protein